MSINRKTILVSAAALALGISSCRKFSNVNTNPNVSQVVTVQTLLPAAQLYIGSAVGTDLQVYGSIWSQYWTQAPNTSAVKYGTIEAFAPGQAEFEMAWRNLYAGAENLFQLQNLADSTNKRQYEAIALLLKAYTFQVITDGWGDVPFRQALKGQYTNGHMINPQFDSQRVVYNGILAHLDSADRLLNVGDGVKPGAEDLVYGGDMAKWVKFSNTLRLKVLLRSLAVDPTNARLRIATLYSRAPRFIGEGDDARIAYTHITTNTNPLYAEEQGAQNIAGSKTCIDAMNANHDYRRNAFYTGGSGLAQGTYKSTSLTFYALPSAAVGADAGDHNSASAGVNLLTSWESYFLQAEATARGLDGGVGTDYQLYYAGILASYNFYGTAIANGSDTTASGAYDMYVNGDPLHGIAVGTWAQYPAAGTVDAKVRHIITQKWFAMCGNQGFEAWTEWRRTGYPDFLVNPAVSAIGAMKPQRFLYPATESTANANYPGLAPITTNVWWDKL